MELRRGDQGRLRRGRWRGRRRTRPAFQGETGDSGYAAESLGKRRKRKSHLIGQRVGVGCDESNFSDLGRTEAKFTYVEERTGDVGVKTMNPNNSSEKLCCKGW